MQQYPIEQPLSNNDEKLAVAIFLSDPSLSLGTKRNYHLRINVTVSGLKEVWGSCASMLLNLQPSGDVAGGHVCCFSDSYKVSRAQATNRGKVIDCPG